MNRFYDSASEGIKEHNPNWLQISDHSYKIVKKTKKTNRLLNLVIQQPDKN